MNAKEKLTKARAGLILDHCFFGSLALRLELSEDASCETAWTDGKKMGYNPSFIGTLSLAETKGLICHEVMHCAANHQARRGDRDPQKFNVAGDFAINPLIEEARLTLPKGRLIDPTYNNMSAEEIYSKLPQSQNQGQNDDPGKCGAVRDAKGEDGKPASPAELTQSREDWKVAVAQAAQQAKGMGQLPAGLTRLVEEVLAPKIDWREVLRRFVDQTAKSNYSWFPPNRRFIHQGLYLPSVKGEELPPIVIVIDTSGSVTQKEINQFSSELTAILQDYHTSCAVIYCDSEVAGVEEFSTDDLPLKLNPRGGGGTDFRPPFGYIEKRGMTPSCLIYLTDLECSSYPPEPYYPTLWAYMGKGGTKPPFGEEVSII